jgi:hypothetical protein
MPQLKSYVFKFYLSNCERDSLNRQTNICTILIFFYARSQQHRDVSCVQVSVFLQGEVLKEIYAFRTDTLACFLPGRAKNLSALQYVTGFSELFVFLLEYNWNCFFDLFRGGECQAKGPLISYLQQLLISKLIKFVFHIQFWVVCKKYVSYIFRTILSVKYLKLKSECMK